MGLTQAVCKSILRKREEVAKERAERSRDEARQRAARAPLGGDSPRRPCRRSLSCRFLATPP